MERDFFNFFDREDRTKELLRLQADKDKVSYASITKYIPDGFERICDIDNLVSTEINWSYTNINSALMFKNHRSWIYFLTRNLEIVKIGETEQPLGIETHPGSGVLVKTTESRLGRYRRHDSGGTGDHGTRAGLQESVENNDVISFWARPCIMTTRSEIVCGEVVDVPVTSHKFMEKYYQDLFIRKVGYLPLLNKIKK